METCLVPDCSRAVFVKSRQLCRPHYKRWHRHGDPEGGISSYRGDSLEDRLRNGTAWDGSCLVWRGARNETGYGLMAVQGRTKTVHRLAYETWVGPIPEGHVVRHKCDNPPCINPEHLETGTHVDNMNDMVTRNRTNPRRGESVGTSRFTEDDIRNIRSLYKVGVTQVEIGKMYQTHQGTISAIVLRKSWKHVPDTE